MEKNLLKVLRTLLGLNKTSPANQPETDGATIDLIRNRLNTYMLQQKPFLKQHYKITHLSNDLEMPLHQLSAFLNKQMGMHFTDYLNQFRIRYCEELIRKERPGRVNLKEIVSKCGFHNRNTFTTAFKKFTGKTPSEYIRNKAYL
ncbi:MAG TPA: helix-turn-helix domain-containing protein [Niastella sp.]